MKTSSKSQTKANKRKGNRLRKFAHIVLLTETLMLTAPMVHAQTAQTDQKVDVQKQGPGDREAEEKGNKGGAYSISNKGLQDKDGNLIIGMDELNREVRKKVNEPQALIDAERKRNEEIKAEAKRLEEKRKQNDRKMALFLALFVGSVIGAGITGWLIEAGITGLLFGGKEENKENKNENKNT
ncbi:hypothetical protein KAW38_02725 [Candidatus Micrarchaeota archaeon]|nr:hypothetical protein [Candidatus Micrarchaeota archaeon]